MASTLSFISLFLALLPSSPGASASIAPPTTSTAAQCRRFVQGFYDWYVPRVNARRVDAEVEALKYKAADFSPELFHALYDEWQIDERTGKINTLDFDPYLNTQAPSTKYVLSEVDLKNDGCYVTVRGLSSRKSVTSVVVPELALRSGHWLFVNFHYPNGRWTRDENLLSILGVSTSRR